MIRKSLFIAIALSFGLGTPALAGQQLENQKIINVVGVNESIVFIAVQNPGPSSVCALSLMTAPLTTLGILQYETARGAKLAGHTVSVFFEDTTCEIDQVQLQ